MLTPAEAVREIVNSVEPVATERVPLMKALGRVSAKDVTSPIDIPQRDNSAMDGYAVRSQDVGGKCPIELAVVEHIPAGKLPSKAVGENQCARIFTGAPIPPGADSVIRQEHTALTSDNLVRVDRDSDVLGNIRRCGEDLPRDSLVVARGAELRPADLGLLASVAEGEVLVYKKPRVAIMATGDEIADLSESAAILEGTKIGSSNTYTMLSAVRVAGGEAVSLGIARDNAEDLRGRFESAKEADLLVTSGGVSVGEHDHLRDVFESLGGKLRFWRIKMRPGKPVAFGVLEGTPWIGLPGNPVSTMVTFELLVRPALRKMQGISSPFRRAVNVRMLEPYSSGTSRTDFIRAVVQLEDGEFTASPTGAQGSGILTSMAKANALVIVPGDENEVVKGQTLRAMLLDVDHHSSEIPY